jgi:hypothetical protein
MIFMLMALLLIGVFQPIRATESGESATISPAASHLPYDEPPAHSHLASGLKSAEDIRRNRAAWEQKMLASAVRLELRVFEVSEDGELLGSLQSSTGHATVKDGRYLVTHNHYGVSLKSEQAGTTTRVTVFKADEEEIILHQPLSAVEIAFEDPQTLVLDFGVCGAMGVFAQLDVASADFRHWQALPLEAGSEACVDTLESV